LSEIHFEKAGLRPVIAQILVACVTLKSQSTYLHKHLKTIKESFYGLKKRKDGL
jgi:hypothetical protein